jgi:hypothetical protein
MGTASDKSKATFVMRETGQRLQRGLPGKGANKWMRHAGVYKANPIGCLKPSQKISMYRFQGEVVVSQKTSKPARQRVKIRLTPSQSVGFEMLL